MREFLSEGFLEASVKMKKEVASFFIEATGGQIVLKALDTFNLFMGLEIDFRDKDEVLLDLIKKHNTSFADIMNDVDSFRTSEKTENGCRHGFDTNGFCKELAYHYLNS